MITKSLEPLNFLPSKLIKTSDILNNHSRICKHCNQPFEISEKQKLWFHSKGFSLPKRCESCRKFIRKSKLPEVKNRLLYTSNFDPILIGEDIQLDDEKNDNDGEDDYYDDDVEDYHNDDDDED